MGQLARAVDDLHGRRSDLASGEAELRSQVGDMFVTLSRRNTTLVNQQLAPDRDASSATRRTRSGWRASSGSTTSPPGCAVRRRA